MLILWLYIINTIFMFIIAIREVRRPAKALNWLAFCLILPIIGFGLYLSTTNPVRISRKKLISPHHESDKLPDSFSRSASVIAHALGQLSVHGLRAGKVQVLINGIKTYEKLLESLQNAQKTIDLEYYIYRDDQIGRRITDLLLERAASGVKIRFVRDGWGSRQFPQRKITEMMNAGIECRTIFPLRFPWMFSNWNYRDHCKIVLIDGKEAFTGGINVGYEYTGLKPEVGFWRDTHLRITGEAPVDLQTIFDSHWNIAAPERIKSKTTQDQEKQQNISKSQIPGKTGVSVGSAQWRTEMDTLEDIDTFSRIEPLQKAYIQTLEGNPGIPTPVVREAYFILVTQATKTIDITTPYFVPDEDIILAIKTAVARGVRVRLLVPRHVDQKIVGLASPTFYGELLESGVQIYLYDKGLLHAKVMIVDEEIAEVGAANYDIRSFRLNYEVCEVVYSIDVARDLTEQFELDLSDSLQLTMEDLQQRSLSQRIIQQGARLLSPLL
ncbi:phospholipase D-like domain-containing protein [Fictibacillus enclensis]|uniref:phospholipase D-like domain-containing protein n=1 Tax=Fictibacillus enclensis TaxID=1017270 RepID=UPI0025A29D05|nr:phospholipase D-like domain-containing protein [Fictibacillus enclensis]MDM5335882.1 phospholipase D-like domain-containing protein [Fictibacillus enclensis]